MARSWGRGRSSSGMSGIGSVNISPREWSDPNRSGMGWNWVYRGVVAANWVRIGFVVGSFFRLFIANTNTYGFDSVYFFRTARLIPSGEPVGVAGRAILQVFDYGTRFVRSFFVADSAEAPRAESDPAGKTQGFCVTHFLEPAARGFDSVLRRHDCLLQFHYTGGRNSFPDSGFGRFEGCNWRDWSYALKNIFIRHWNGVAAIRFLT